MKSAQLLQSLALFLFCGLSSDDDNETAHLADPIICVYPISGQYSLLNRVLFYVLWLFAAFGQKWTWPSICALAYIMAYSATAALHAMVLCIVGHRKAVDLDIFGTWAIISVASSSGFALTMLSDRLRNTFYRPVVAFWSSFVSLGALFSIYMLFTLGENYSEEPACWSAGSYENSNVSTLLVSPVQLEIRGVFNCSYTCFSTKQSMRDPKELVVLPLLRLSGAWSNMLSAAMVIFFFTGGGIGLFTCGWAGDRKRTRSELTRDSNRPAPRFATSRVTRHAIYAKIQALKELRTGRFQRDLTCWPIMAATFAPVIAVLNEVYLLAPSPLPTSEAPFAVGQWASWVTIAFALIAAWYNDRYGPEWEKIKTVLDYEHEELLHSQGDTTQLRSDEI